MFMLLQCTLDDENEPEVVFLLPPHHPFRISLIED